MSLVNLKHNYVAAVYYLAKDETLVATTAKRRLRKITLNITSFTSTNVKLRLRFDIHLTFH